MTRLDASLFRAVNRLADRTPWAHGAVAAYARLGLVAFAALLLTGWWLSRSSGDLDLMARVLWAGAGALVALGVNQVVGALVDRARPYAAMPHVHVLISRTTDASFPSDHAVVAGAVVAGLLLARRRLGAAAVVLALMMGAARVYAGAHYPGDVIAGLLLGGAVVVAGGLLAVPALRGLAGAVSHSRLRPLVCGRPLPAPGLRR